MTYAVTIGKNSEQIQEVCRTSINSGFISANHFVGDNYLYVVKSTTSDQKVVTRVDMSTGKPDNKFLTNMIFSSEGQCVINDKFYYSSSIKGKPGIFVFEDDGTSKQIQLSEETTNVMKANNLELSFILHGGYEEDGIIHFLVVNGTRSKIMLFSENENVVTEYRSNLMASNKLVKVGKDVYVYYIISNNIELKNIRTDESYQLPSTVIVEGVEFNLFKYEITEEIAMVRCGTNKSYYIPIEQLLIKNQKEPLVVEPSFSIEYKGLSHPSIPKVTNKSIFVHGLEENSLVTYKHDFPVRVKSGRSLSDKHVN